MAYESVIGPNELIIDDDTPLFDLIHPVVDGVTMGMGYEARDWFEDPFGSFAAPYNLPVIPRDEWEDRIAEMETSGSRLSDIIKRRGMGTKNQGATNYCWVFAATSAVQCQRIFQGNDHLELSPASVGCLVTNYRNVGGWSTQAIREGAKSGWAPSSIWPDTGISRQYNTPEAQDARKDYQVEEWWELTPRSEAELMTCLLGHFPVAVGFNWWRHAVLACDPVAFGNNEFGIRILNSWGPSWGDQGWGILRGSKRIADDAVTPRLSA